jgi:NAD(P)-dependent dehydrogenase (short-subunit alcohol dehydrogenase family)
MKMRHAMTEATYELLTDGTVRVETTDGASGIFRTNGRWLRGEVRDADPQMLDFLDGSSDLGNRRTGSLAHSEATNHRGVALPELATTNSRTERRSIGMDLGLNGRKALVTAATRGIGLAIAQTFADEGCDVAICARGEAGLESARKDLEARGAKVFTQAIDVSDGDALKQFVADAAEALGGLDIYVSNASGGAGPGEKAWQASFDVDVMGAVRGIDAALPSLANSDAASVVLISSTAALEYLGIPQAYSAMKAALIAHAGDMSQALAPQGIRVNVISPGPIYFEGGNWEMIKQAMPEMYEGALAQCAIGRMGAPEEVARATAFIASPAASLITGANLVCDGGFTKRMPF